MPDPAPPPEPETSGYWHEVCVCPTPETCEKAGRCLVAECTEKPMPDPAVVELLAALDMTAGGLSTDCDHWDRQRRAEEAVRRFRPKIRWIVGRNSV